MIHRAAIALGCIAAILAIAVAAASPAQPGKIAWSTVTLNDPAFHLPAFRVKIPSDWSFEGAVVRTVCEGAMLVYRTESPDGRTGVQLLPRVQWVSSQNALALRSVQKGCGDRAPLSALAQAAEIALAMRPQAAVDKAEAWTPPGRAETIEKHNRMFQKSAKTSGFPDAATRESADGARVRIHYSYLGQGEEECIQVSVVVEDEPVAISTKGPDGIFRASFARASQARTYAGGMRAPQSELDATMPLFQAIKAEEVPGYAEAVFDFNSHKFDKVKALARKLHVDPWREDLEKDYQAYMRFLNPRETRPRSFVESRTEAAKQSFIDYVSGQTYYRPEGGMTVTVRNGAGVSATAPDPGREWVHLQPVSHGGSNHAQGN